MEYGVLMRESEGNKNHVEDLRVNGWIILKCFVKILHIWTDLIWPRKGQVGLLGTR